MASRNTTGRRRRAPGAGRPRSDFTAAVRYVDGSSELIHVRNADDIDDARAMVLDALTGVRVVMLTQRGSPEKPD